MSERRPEYVGAALSPRETRKHCLGRGSYVGDLTAPRMLHAAFVRSPHAHARIGHVDAAAARRAPGIAAVLTGPDLAALTAPLRIAPPIPGLSPMEMPTLPTDKVRFVGDPLACVIGEDRYRVEDACALVDVAYEPLAAVVDPERAQDPGLPRVDETIAANRAYDGVFAHGNVEAAMGAADRRDRRALPSGTPDARAARAARLPRELAARGRDADLLALDPDPASDALRARRAPRDPGERGPGDRARRGRRLRPEDPALPRGADDGRRVAAARPPGPLDRDAPREPPRRAPRTRGHRRRPRRGAFRRHHPGPGRSDPRRLRRLRLLPRQLHGARRRHDDPWRVPPPRLPLRHHRGADEQVPVRSLPRADADL